MPQLQLELNRLQNELLEIVTTPDAVINALTLEDITIQEVGDRKFVPFQAGSCSGSCGSCVGGCTEWPCQPCSCL
jgi:hypothetical protein